MSTMRVHQIMSQPVITCGVQDRLSAAAALMWEHDCGAIPVVDERGGLAGIITDRDICMGAYTQGRALNEIRVADVMAPEVFACRGDDTLDAAERMMSEKQVRRVPVIDQAARPIGFLSLNDIVREATRTRQSDGVEPALDLVQTLAAIGQPRQQQEI